MDKEDDDDKNKQSQGGGDPYASYAKQPPSSFSSMSVEKFEDEYLSNVNFVIDEDDHMLTPTPTQPPSEETSSMTSSTRMMIAPPPLVRHRTEQSRPGAIAVPGPGSSRSLSCNESLMNSSVASVTRRRSSSYDEQLWNEVLINAVLVEDEDQEEAAAVAANSERHRDMPFVEATPMRPARKPWHARWCITSSLLLSACIIVAIVLALTTRGGTVTSLRSGSSPTSPSETPSPTPVPTMPPSSLGLVDISIVVQLDEHPNETGFSLTCDRENVEEVLPGTYGSNRKDSALVTNTKVKKGASCVFIIVDSGSNGIVNGFYEVYLGEDVSNLDNRLVSGTGDFVDNARAEFTVEPPVVTPSPTLAPTVESTLHDSDENSQTTVPPTVAPTQSPSAAPTSVVPVTVVIRLDGNPGDTSWRLKCGARTVYNVPPKNYQGQENRLVTVQAYLQVGEECEFTIFDQQGDGLDGGYFELYAGEDILDATALLGLGTGDFGSEKTVSFQVVPPPPPAPTSSPAPSMEENDVVPVTLDIQLDKFPSETGWLLECDGDVQGYVPATAYVEEYQRITHTFYLDEGAHCKLRITDTYGDGLCCRFGDGYFRLYLGLDTSDDSKLILDGDDFNFVKEAFFTVESNGQDLQPPTSPPSSGSDNGLGPESVEVPITVVIKMDDHPEDIAWSLTCQGVELINMSEGTYTEPEQVIMETVEVEESSECEFVITDTYGEGLNGEGFYQIYISRITSISQENLLHEGKGFGFREEIEFDAFHQ